MTAKYWIYGVFFISLHVWEGIQNTLRQIFESLSIFDKYWKWGSKYFGREICPPPPFRPSKFQFPLGKELKILWTQYMKSQNIFNTLCWGISNIEAAKGWTPTPQSNFLLLWKAVQYNMTTKYWSPHLINTYGLWYLRTNVSGNSINKEKALILSIQFKCKKKKTHWNTCTWIPPFTNGCNLWSQFFSCTCVPLMKYMHFD